MNEGSESPADPPERSGLRFSVVVPTYNRPAQLAGCVAALRALLRPGGALEIVIVNDGGAALPSGIVSPLPSMGADDVRLRVLEQSNAGPATARNAGAQVARGEFVAFTDDDCRPDPGWLTAFDVALRADPSALAGGRTMNAIATSVYAEVSQQLADFVSAYFDGGAGGRFFTSNNIAVSRDAFFAAGAFDVRFPFSAGEDRELCDRWSAQGRPSVSVPDAVVRHAHDLSAPRFLRQHFTYGRGAVAFRRVRAATGRPVRVDPAFYVRSLAHAVRAGKGLRGLALAALTLVAHAAYAAGLLWESRVRPTRSRGG